MLINVRPGLLFLSIYTLCRSFLKANNSHLRLLSWQQKRKKENCRGKCSQINFHLSFFFISCTATRNFTHTSSAFPDILALIVSRRTEKLEILDSHFPRKFWKESKISRFSVFHHTEFYEFTIFYLLLPVRRYSEANSTVVLR